MLRTDSPEPPSASVDETPPPKAAAVTFRAVAVGVVLVAIVGLITPYNNYALNNTDLIGNAFPAAILLALIVLVMIVNGLLTRFAPRRRLSAGELIVITAMMLVGSAIPAVGMMRYLPGHLVAFWQLADERPEYLNVLEQAGPADWIFPDFESASLDGRGKEDVVRGFFVRLPADRSTLAGQIDAVPWAKWIRPAVTWGVFFGALFAAAIGMIVVMNRQWVRNERLAFPLAGIYLSLVEPPPPGRAVNNLLRSPALWIAAGAVFLIHASVGLHAYFPETVPSLKLGFDLLSITADRPWNLADWKFRYQDVFFTIIGLSFFLRTRLTLSIWLCYVLGQTAIMIGGSVGAEISAPMIADQILGAASAMAAWIIYLARDHLRGVVASIFTRRPLRPIERTERLGLIVLIVSAVVLVVWLDLAGASLAGAMLIVGGLLTAYLVVARVVAETGLPYVLIPMELNRPFIAALANFGSGARTTIGSFFYASMFGGMLLHDTRQALPGFAVNAVRMGETVTGTAHRRRWFFGAIALALLVSYLAGGAGTLFTRYNYDVTLDQQATPLDNNWGSYGMPRDMTMAPTHNYIPPRQGPVETHSRVGNFAVGAGMIATLGILKTRLAGWPIDPVGFLLCWTWGVGVTWFSIFLGWLVKTSLSYLVGPTGVAQAKPIFVGLIIGETLAVLFWLTLNFVLSAAGMPFYRVTLLPN